MAWLRKRGRTGGLGLVLTLAIGPACNSDEKPRSANDETTESGTTETTDDGEDETTEDTGPPPDKTCRDAVQCILACAADYPANPTPEDPDLEDFFLACFLECGQDLDGEEALALIRLVSCVSDKCYADMSCVAPGAETESDGGATGENQDDICAICLAGGLLDPMPSGCEAEAEACK